MVGVHDINSFPLTLWVKAACFVLAIEVLHARILTLICACPIFKANFSHYKFSNAILRNFEGFLAEWPWAEKLQNWILFQMEKELQAYGFLMRWKIQMKAQIYVN